MCTDEYVSETEQVLYSSGEISSCADEGLKVRLPVSEAHWAQLLQLLLELSVWWTWHNMTRELFKVLLIKIMCERFQNEIIISDLIVNPFK